MLLVNGTAVSLFLALVALLEIIFWLTALESWSEFGGYNVVSIFFVECRSIAES